MTKAELILCHPQFYCRKDTEYNDLATIFFNTQVSGKKISFLFFILIVDIIFMYMVKSIITLSRKKRIIFCMNKFHKNDIYIAEKN